MRLPRIAAFLLLLGPACMTRAELRFQVHAWEQQGLLTEDTVWNAMPPLFYGEGGGRKSLRATRGQTSPVHRYDGTSPLRFYKRGAAADALPYAQVDFDPAWENMVVLLFPDQVGSDGLVRAQALDIAPEKAPAGKAYFYNGSGSPLRVQVNGRVLQLQPHGSVLLAPREFGQSSVRGMTMSQVYLARPDAEGEWKQIHSAVLYLKADHPNLFLIMNYGRRVQIRTLYPTSTERNP